MAMCRACDCVHAMLAPCVNLSELVRQTLRCNNSMRYLTAHQTKNIKPEENRKNKDFQA